MNGQLVNCDEPGQPPRLSDAELTALREWRTRPARYARPGRQIADSLRKEMSEFDDVTLGRFALRFASYLAVAERSQPGVTAAAVAGVLAAAAAELTALEGGQAPRP